MTTYCSNCGNRLGEGDQFCASCGSPVPSVVAQPTPTHVSQPVPAYPQGVLPQSTGMLSQLQDDKNEKASFAIAVVALCFAALAAVWSFIGGACCGWAGWGWAFVGLVLSGVSLILRRTPIGWWALGLSIFAFAWVFISAYLLGVGAGGAARGMVR